MVIRRIMSADYSSEEDIATYHAQIARDIIYHLVHPRIRREQGRILRHRNGSYGHGPNLEYPRWVRSRVNCLAQELFNRYNVSALQNVNLVGTGRLDVTLTVQTAEIDYKEPNEIKTLMEVSTYTRRLLDNVWDDDDLNQRWPKDLSAIVAEYLLPNRLGTTLNVWRDGSDRYQEYNSGHRCSMSCAHQAVYEALRRKPDVMIKEPQIGPIRPYEMFVRQSCMYLTINDILTHFSIIKLLEDDLSFVISKETPIATDRSKTIPVFRVKNIPNGWFGHIEFVDMERNWGIGRWNEHYIETYEGLYGNDTDLLDILQGVYG
jgi:hypothetical protein